MRLRVVITHFDAPQWLRSSVESLLRSEGVDLELVVVHNGGTLPALPSGVRVLEAGSNRGFSGGANLGLRAWLDGADESYCVVGSHDLHVEPDTLRLLVETAEDNPDYGLLGPVLGRNELPDRGEDVRQERWISGACILLRRKCVDDIGVFDESFGSYCEDVDLGFRARRSGWSVGRVRSAVAYDLGSASPDAARMTMLNMLRLRALHPQELRGVWFGVGNMPVRAALNLLRGIDPRLSRQARALSRSAARTRVLAIPAAVRLARELSGSDRSTGGSVSARGRP